MAYDDLILDAEARYGLPRGLLGGVINLGERSGPSAVSPKGAMGVAQLMPGTAADLGVSDRADPAQSIDGGARYLRQQLDAFGDPALAVAAYNAGPGAVTKAGGIPNFAETQAYVQRVAGGMDGSDIFGSPDQPAGPAGPGDPNGPSQRMVASPSGGQALEITTGNAGMDGTGADIFADAPSAPAPAGPAEPPPPAFTLERGLKRGARDAMEFVGGTADFFSDPILAAANVATVGAQGGKGEAPFKYGGARDALSGLAERLGLPAAETTPERYGSAMTQGVLGGLTGVGIGSQLKSAAGAGTRAIGEALADSPVRQTIAGATAGLSQQGAADAGLGPVGQFAAGLAGGMLGFGGASVPAAVVGLRDRAASLPLAARFSPAAAERQAGEIIARRADDPAAVRESVVRGPDEIVPGSRPTTFQQTGDIGLGALEREQAVKNPAAFAQRRADQNMARRRSLADVQQGGDPNEIAKVIRQHFDDLDAETEAAVTGAQQAGEASVAGVRDRADRTHAAATDVAQSHTDALGGTGTPEGYGADLRATISRAEEARKQQSSKLYDAVDPDQNMTGNATPIIRASDDITADIPKAAKPMEGEEAAIFEQARSLPRLAPMREVFALRSRVGDAMRAEKKANGSTQSYRRLTMLQEAIHNNLSDTIAHEVQRDDMLVARGVIQPQEALIARLQGAFDELRTGQATARTGSGGDYGQGGSVGTASASRSNGAAVPAGRGSGSAPRNSRLPSDAELQAARDDIDLWRKPNNSSLFGAVRQLGGVKLRDVSTGAAVPGPDIGAAVQDIRYPGLVNNAGGLSPERMAQALADAGWFGPNVGDASAAFEAAMGREARGSKVFHPEDAKGAQRQRLEQIEEDAVASGASAVNSPTLAAQRLARYRGGRADYENIVAESGVPNASEMSPEELLGDLEERAAIQAESGPARPSEAEAEFDRLYRSGERPSVDEGALKRMEVANKDYRDMKATFGVEPVKGVLKSLGMKGDFALPDGSVPGKFFRPGAASFEGMNAALKASPDALPILQDYAAMSLKRDAMTAEGVIDPAKFDRWSSRFADSLRAFPPETRARFANAAEAGKAVAEAAVARVAKLKAAEQEAAAQVVDAVNRRKAALADAKKGPTGRLLNRTEPQDVTRTIGAMLEGQTAVADMKALAEAAKGDPDARAGVRQSIADHIADKYVSNTEAGTSDQTLLKADAFQSFVRRNRTAMQPFFSTEELATIDAIARDIRRAKRSENAVKLPGGSNTAQDQFGVAKNGRAGQVATRSVLDAVGAVVGHTFGGPAGALAGAFGADFVQGLRAAGIDRVDQLVTRAMLEPEVAARLLKQVPDAGPTSMQKRSLIRALGVGAVTSPDDQRGGRP